MQAAVIEYQGKARQWTRELKTLSEKIGSRFARREMHERAFDYVRGLLSPIERKNGWQLAEAVHRPNPYSIQHLLDRARWDAQQVRDDVRDYVVEALSSEAAVLVVDETGFLKKGRHSAGVARQYSGTAGRIENCQIGVFLAYASDRGRALIDRELYLPKAWADDEAARHFAKIPDDIRFATKPQLAQAMIERALSAHVPFAYITGDEIYGDNRSLRAWLEQQGVCHVLAVAGNQYVWPDMNGQKTVRDLAETFEEQDWTTLSAGDGVKGARQYEWARVDLLSWQMPHRRCLLVRRSLGDTPKLAYYVCYAPKGTSLSELVRVAGARWAVEACFEAAKSEVGLDQYEVRSWHGWYRHMTLAMTAQAYLAVLCAREEAPPAFKKKKMHPSMRDWKHHRLS